MQPAAFAPVMLQRSGPPPRLQLSMALVCMSNVNRSMEAHLGLISNGYNPQLVGSFGVGTKVKLPGETARTANSYAFGTPYSDMHTDLRRKNQHHYTLNGMLGMLERDGKVKLAPQRFQGNEKVYDLVITYEKRVFDVVVEDLRRRKAVLASPCHVINLETTDSHGEARKGSTITLALVEAIHNAANEPQPEVPRAPEGAAGSSLVVEGGVDEKEVAAEAAARAQALAAYDRKMEELAARVRGVEEDAIEDAMLAQMARHLPYPAAQAQRLDMRRWEARLPGILAGFEREHSKAIDHCVLWF